MTDEGRYIDLWEIVPCDYCGMPAGQECRTAGGNIRRPSHTMNRILDPYGEGGPRRWSSEHFGVSSDDV